MSDARPHDEASEVEALTDEHETDEGAGPDAQEDASATSVDGTEAGGERVADADETGQRVEDAGTGTADTSDDPQLDAPD